MKILLIDNYDSFTFNLLQLFREAGADDIHVKMNDEISLPDALVYDAFVISPGPGLPSEAGITCDLIRKYSESKRIFGVCLGMQAIADVFGGKLFQPGEIMHGEMVRVSPAQPVDSLFTGIETGFDAGLYHSWAVEKETLPDGLRITAVDDRGVIMGLKHVEFKISGVQFHPESIMTPMGRKLIENWLQV
ncbi:MAG: aminodeoxychorismate/anthranilate synthase component II [Bacteroidales bacterium]|nr:aminodeoxychorismate/anthranilate synthase component II [Bacteroidales bacterium]